jgi:predicted kinase
MPEHSLVVLIGPSGAGKSTIARTWPASQVLSLDTLREVVSDDFSVKLRVLKMAVGGTVLRDSVVRS